MIRFPPLFIAEFPRVASVEKGSISSFATSKKRYYSFATAKKRYCSFATVQNCCCLEQSRPFICNGSELLLFATVASLQFITVTTVEKIRIFCSKSVQKYMTQSTLIGPAPGLARFGSVGRAGGARARVC